VPPAFSPEEAASIASLEIDDLLSLNDPATLEQRHEHFAIPGTVSSDYLEKFYWLANGKLILAGIRHLSGHRDEPFVHVMSSFAPTIQDLSILADLARARFSMFRPKGLSLALKPSVVPEDIVGDLRLARRVVVGKLSEILNRPRPVGFERISFEPFDIESRYSWYESAYRDFHLERPSLRKWVPITDRSDLRACANDGWIFQVRIDEKVAGLIAAESRALLGRTGAYMTELLLVPPFRGQGLAAALQRKFVETLARDSEGTLARDSEGTLARDSKETLAREVELIWGTIDSGNQASMSTARRVGRTAIRSEYFLKL